MGSLALAQLFAGAMASCAWSQSPPPALRLVRLKAEICSSHAGLEAVEIPYRNEASHVGEPVGLPDTSYTFDLEVNTFAINDDGVIVGSFGLPLNPCEPPTGYAGVNPKKARAFVWVPFSNTTVAAAIPRGQVVDLQSFGGLSATDRSIAVDVSRSSAWVTGSAGSDFSINSKAWAWHLAGATSSGGTLASIPAVLLHPLIGNPSEPDPDIAGARSIGMAVRHEIGDPTPTFVGAFTYECGEDVDRWKGFRLVYQATPDTYQLWGLVDGGFKSAARDITIHPQATGSDPTMVVGGNFDCFGASLDPCDAPVFPCSHPCFSSNRFGVIWRALWDDNDENPGWTPLELPYLRDRADEVLPPLETTFGPTGSDGFRAEVRVNRANAVGELAGVGARDSTDTDPPTPGTCRHRAGFWWNEPSEGDPIGWKAWDVDAAYGALNPLVNIQSRAWGLSERSASREVLLVGGEDNTEEFARAACWCGYAELWQRSFVGFTGNDPSAEPRVRWDELDVLGTLDAQYGLNLASWEVESVHDVNRLGQMIVLLRGEPGLTEGHVYPAVVTLASDLNGDFTVSAADLAILIGDWGAVPTATVSTQADLDGDGIVGAADLSVVLGDWGLVTDLHPYFCPAGLQGMSEESTAAASGVPTAETVSLALAVLGWTDIAQLQAWTATATVQQLQGLGEALLLLSTMEPEQ